MDPFNGATTSLPVPESFQAPQRTGTTALWTHLLRKDAQASNNIGIIPPIAPIDKNATTMRVLLHDTQANFEAFSARVDKLINVVEETKREIKTTSTLFEREHDTLVGDVIDLVNRSQKEIQNSIGTPTQAPATDAFFKDVDRRLEGLNQRLDAAHAALQTQMQAILTLQEQQGTILASVLPLLPLVQSIPLHLESLKTDLRAAVQAEAVSITPKASTGFNQNQTLPLAKKRTHSDVDVDANFSSPMSSLLTAKRARVEKATEAAETTSAKRDSETEAPRLAMSSPDKEPPKSLIVSSLLKQLQRTSTSPTGVVNTLSASLGNATPRRPLADISLAQLERPPSIAGRLSSRSNTLLPRASSPLVLGITPSATRPPRILRVHTSTSGSARNNNAPPGSSKPNSATAAIPALLTEKTKSFASNGNLLLTLALKTPVRAPSVAPIRPQQSTPLKSTPRHPAPEPSSSSNLTEPSQSEIPTATKTSAMCPPRPRPIRKNTQVPKPDIVPITPTVPAQEIVPFKSSPIVNLAEGQRERRSPFRAGRRFIPLVDTDEEDEDE
ncbi:uncharacterized protein LACBIDRAFT_303942 [Laccaria bicolor S238N-H82]|uniref:Predicted protein n=1 Tax=Laccaria bicolor (strain S238N-H82 / ATCC MYA-4686) TaxID=486041 RepID=B0DIF2_LACBS|nr:uncharacterized protein LACBIDRAFT_302842 [Laccaria bicolor S238N-H82]XP_001891020.1 uncharacterized protein LACBIDRAFT_303942 [Laccaria bicolor S238N-H82]EDQ98327.1 predicted protein [Laccaria bicolor S238N-H82]EDR05555.1 predicted protein [Laccaria bicolor S238N-H82]|eukprot:XP_001883659.1 predicted protein [Laccaria bicolor S238N-H82]